MNFRTRTLCFIKKTGKNLAIKSLRMSANERKLIDLIEEIRRIVPDISNQETTDRGTTDPYIELKRRLLHAFQSRFVLKFLDALPSGKHSIVDIGDSAGTHSLYLKALYKNGPLETVGVNLEQKSIDRIKSQGLKAILKRAEDLTAEDIDGDISLFTTFEMVEHLHNPAIFFRRLSKRGNCNSLIVTVPYVRESRVALAHLKMNSTELQHAEAVHIFELSPEDWKKIMLHGGWKAVREEVIHQYPRSPFFLRPFWKMFWKKIDYEGFWAVELSRDTSRSDLYTDWED